MTLKVQDDPAERSEAVEEPRFPLPYHDRVPKDSHIRSFGAEF